MELKPGYKQTEVGVIPEDWDCVSIQSAASNTSNAIVGGPFGSDLTSSDYVYSGVPVVRGANMGSKMIGGSFVFVSTSKASALSANLAQPQDLVFTQRGTLGQVSLVPDEPFESYLISQSQMKVSLDGARYGSEYVYHYFSSAPGRKQILDSAIQTGVPHTNLGICRKYVFPAPCITEQEKICDVLNDIDSQLQLIGRLLDKKKQIKQAAMQELLTGKRRLPGFEGEWKTVAISQVAEKITGFWGRTEPGSEAMHSTSVIRAGDISEEGRLIGAARRYLSQHESSLAGCRPGDTVMTASGNGLGKSWTCDQDEVYSASNFVRIIRPQRGKADGYFVGFALKSRRARSKLVEHTATSAYPNLKPSFFNDKWLSLPPEPEQKAISDVLRDIDIEIIELEARKLKAAQLKQGMMQQLLTGKIRLK